MKNRQLKACASMLRHMLRLKILALSLLFSISVLSFNAQAHSNKVAYSNKRNVAVSSILSEIEKNSDYVFFYSNDIKSKLNQKTNLPNGSYTVEEVLDIALTSTDLTYKVTEKQISLLKKERSKEVEVLQAPQSDATLKGQVLDPQGLSVIGANVMLEGTVRGATTDNEGFFEIKDVQLPVRLVVTYIGFETKKVFVTKNELVKITMEEQATLDEIVITGWGAQKKTTMVGSISSVKPKELKGPTSNLTTMLAGRAAGLISYQLSGEPGRDNAEFFVRGVGSFGSGKSNPLILIDGVESTMDELARIQPDDLESFSVLKDATATSMYGSRGANGVLLIKTKSGAVGKPKFNVRYEGSMSQNTKSYKLADNITYMRLANEATTTRNPLASRPYAPSRIDKTVAGANPLLYPSNNWQEMMIKDNTLNHRVNLNVSGGADIARYYVAGTYKVDNGILKESKLNDFNTNSKNTSMEVRSNIDLSITPTTEASVRVSGLFNELSGPSLNFLDNQNNPVKGGAGVFQAMMLANPVAFPAIYPSEYVPWVNHPLFGNTSIAQEGSTSSVYFNPYAQALKGYEEESKSAITAQLEINQDFSFLTEGLRARMMAYAKRNNFSGSTREVNPFYYRAEMDLDQNDKIKSLTNLNPETGREYLNFSSSPKEVWQENSFEFNIFYDKTLNQVHQIGLTTFAYIKDFKLTNVGNNLERSLPQRNVSFSGRATYGYDNRYLGEINFGYNASERFGKQNRWGFFPSVGVAWNLAEEHFMVDQKNWLDKFKVRLSYGLVGNDNLTNWIDYGEERFFFLDMVNMDAGGINFGTQNDKGYALINMQRYGNPNITWEKASKYNLAFELGLFKGLNIEMDFFMDKRKNILQTRSDLPGSMGLEGEFPRSNYGKVESKGFEATVDYNTTLNKDMWLSARGTFTFSTNEVTRYDEPEYASNIWYRSRLGYPHNTLRGLIAERLFIDDYDVANSPKQTFSDYSAGDIKYRDVNGDAIVDSNDMVPMGKPTVPEIVFGFGFSYGYKDFDISAFFQGQARTSFMINPGLIQPFENMGDGRVRGLLQAIADDHWSESNRDSYAFFPRLSNQPIGNNVQSSSWWMRDGSFFRLKTVELGYQPTASKPWLRKMGLNSLRVYVSGMNLFTVSKFKIWDVEMKNNGFGYPLQRVFNAGLQLSF